MIKTISQNDGIFISVDLDTETKLGALHAKI